MRKASTGGLPRDCARDPARAASHGGKLARKRQPVSVEVQAARVWMRTASEGSRLARRQQHAEMADQLLEPVPIARRGDHHLRLDPLPVREHHVGAVEPLDAETSPSCPVLRAATNPRSTVAPRPLTRSSVATPYGERGMP